MKYFSIYHTDTQSFLSTGSNSTSLKELVDSYRDYDVELEENLTDEQVIQTINNLGYTIEETDTFIDNIDWGDEY